MIKPNMNYKELKDSYLFFNIAKKTKAYLEEHPDKTLLRLGIGDVTLPLAPVVVEGLKSGVEDQAKKDTFHGYMPECGASFLREAIKAYYEKRNVILDADEVFVSSGASDELGDILDLFDRDNTVMIMEPAYPAYVDANVIEGHRIIHVPSSTENGFVPSPDENACPDIIYLCSPNNPTGAIMNYDQLKAWVDYANACNAVIIFDAAYEAFISDENVPHSIFEVEGARTCAIEISSLSKTAGFTGTRCGYTVIPVELVREGMSFHDMWVRNRTTKTNGVSYIIQKGAAAVFTPEGQKQVRENIEYYKRNGRILMEVLDDLHIPYFGGKNAPYIWMKCPAPHTNSWDFFDYLLNEGNIVGTPGEGFGSCGDGYFRFSTFGRQEDTIEAAKRLRELLK